MKRILIVLAIFAGFIYAFFILGMGRKESPTHFFIFNTHEHIQSIQEVPKYLEAMKQIGVEKTVLLGSSEATIFSGHSSFTEWEENNAEILQIAATDPEHFIAFPTLDPQDPQKIEKLKSYLEKGAKGLKLYSGHVIFHKLSLDDKSVMPLYKFCEGHQIPILFHVNAGYYQKELENVLKQFPKLKIICPHFCLSTIKSERFEYLMDTYPTLYTDISFGPMDYLVAALKRFSLNPQKYRNLILKYQDRIFYGTDMVVTRDPEKTVDWLTQVAQVYKDFLEKEQYTFFEFPNQTLRGLHLDEEVLKKIYHTNFKRFFYGKSETNF